MKKLGIVVLAVVTLMLGCAVLANVELPTPPPQEAPTNLQVHLNEDGSVEVMPHPAFFEGSTYAKFANVDIHNWTYAGGDADRASWTIREIEFYADVETPPIEPPVDSAIPQLSDVTVLWPGTASVLSWPVVVDLDMIARLDGDDIRISWPALLGDWPATDHDLSSEGLRPYFGVTGWIYRTGGRFVAHPNEYARPDREQTGTYWGWAEKFEQAAQDNPGLDLGEPDAGTPIGIFIAGMWRHAENLSEYRRRSEVVWLTWPGLEPWGR